MKLRLAMLATAGLAVVAVVQATAFQGKGKEEPAAAQGDMPQGPKPTKEHEQLKHRVGTWDATVKMMGGPTAEASKGTAVVRMVGDFWAVEEFTGTMMGETFTGHGVAGWDPKKKKWVSTWVDSMTDHLTVMEGTSDSPTRITYMHEGPSMTGSGANAKHKLVSESKDHDHATLSFSETGADGKEIQTMQIEYTRRKQ